MSVGGCTSLIINIGVSAYSISIIPEINRGRYLNGHFTEDWKI